METIAHEAEPRPDPATTALGRDNPYRLVEIECAPRVTDRVGDDLGVGETVKVPAIWLSISQHLVAAGRDRAFHSSARGRESKPLLRAAWRAIWRIWTEEAAPAGMSQTKVAELVGVSRAQLHTILKAGEAESGK